MGAAAFLAGCSSDKPTSPVGGTSGSQAAQGAGVFAVAQAKRGGTIIQSAGQPTTGWNPHVTLASPSLTAMEPMAIKLIRHDYTRIKTPWTVGADDLIIGELAGKWETPDPLTYNFTLRKGIHWPNQEPMNGQAMTAQDVQYTFDHAKLPTSTVEARIIDRIKSVAALDDYTVQLKLNAPHWRWAPDLDGLNICILPRGYFEWAGKDSTSSEKARGGGPWILEEHRPDQVSRYRANENYRKVFGVPYVDEVVVNMLASGAPQLQAWAGKQIQFFSPQAGLVDAAKKARPDTPWTSGYSPGGTVALNMQNNQKPFDDVRVRRAISMAVDRDGWGKTLQGEYKLESGPVDWGMPSWKLDPANMPADARRWLALDRAESKKLLAAAGISPTKTFTMNMYPYSQSYHAHSQLLIDWLSQVGMTAKLRIHEYNNWSATVYNSKYEDLMYAPYSADRLSQQVERLTAGSNRNHSDARDADTQQMLKDFAEAKSVAEAKTITDKIQIRAVDQAFSVYQPQAVSFFTWDPAVQNYDGQKEVIFQGHYRAAMMWLA